MRPYRGSPPPVCLGGPQTYVHTTKFCALFQAGFCSSDRRQYSTSLIITVGHGPVILAAAYERMNIRIRFDILLIVHISIFILILTNLMHLAVPCTRRPPIRVMIPETVEYNFDLLTMSTCARNM